MPVLSLLAPILFVACGDSDVGLSRTEVEEIVRAEMAKAPPSQQPEPGLTSTDLEEAIRKAMADMPQPEPGLTRKDVEEIVEAAIAGIPVSQPGLTPAEAEQIAHRLGLDLKGWVSLDATVYNFGPDMLSAT